jgi:tetratricopeptide (TPR) repeat protein
MTRKKFLLEDAINQYSEAARLFGGADRAAAYNDLGNSFVALFSYTGEKENLNHAITKFEEAYTDFSQMHIADIDGRKIAVVVGLGIALLRRYQHLQSKDDLLQAMKYFRLSLVNIDEWHPRSADRAVNLSSALQLRFLIEGSTKYLKEAERIPQRAFDSPVRLRIHTKICLETQVGNLFHRLHQTADKTADTMTNLDLAISHYRGALAVLGGDPFDRAITELDLATALREKAEITLDADCWNYS